MKREPRWISKALALAIHEALLAEHGGATGIRDEGLLDSALAGPKNLLAYEDPDVFRLAAAYAFGLTRNHPFQDGNKRVALTVAGTFLELNGFRLEASEADAARVTIALSARELDRDGFAAWLKEFAVKASASGDAEIKRSAGRRRPGPRSK